MLTFFLYQFIGNFNIQHDISNKTFTPIAMKSYKFINRNISKNNLKKEKKKKT